MKAHHKETDGPGFVGVLFLTYLGCGLAFAVASLLNAAFDVHFTKFGVYAWAVGIAELASIGTGFAFARRFGVIRGWLRFTGAAVMLFLSSGAIAVLSGGTEAPPMGAEDLASQMQVMFSPSNLAPFVAVFLVIVPLVSPFLLRDMHSNDKT